MLRLIDAIASMVIRSKGFRRYMVDSGRASEWLELTQSLAVSK